MGATSQPQVFMNWKQVCVSIILKYFEISIIDNLILKNMQKYEIQQRQPGQVCGVINISEVAYLSFVFHHLVYE